MPAQRNSAQGRLRAAAGPDIFFLLCPPPSPSTSLPPPCPPPPSSHPSLPSHPGRWAKAAREPRPLSANGFTQRTRHVPALQTAEKVLRTVIEPKASGGALVFLSGWAGGLGQCWVAYLKYLYICVCMYEYIYIYICALYMYMYVHSSFSCCAWLGVTWFRVVCDKQQVCWPINVVRFGTALA